MVHCSLQRNLGKRLEDVNVVFLAQGLRALGQVKVEISVELVVDGADVVEVVALSSQVRRELPQKLLWVWFVA